MPFAETVNSTGTLRADEGVELQAETNGKIVAINFTEGSRVREGELLVKLNDSDLRATLTRATYRKQLAQLRERRLSQLLGQKVVTQNDYDTALSDMNVQDAEIALVQAQIEKTEIRAPFDGVVGLRYVSTGAYVNATTRIATVQRLDRLKIDFALPEKYIGRLKVGSPVTFTVAGGEGRIKGEIYAFDPRIDTGTRTLLIRAVCRNQEGRLLPGTFANVELTLTELRAAVLIPSEAVIPGVNEKNVFVMNDGKAERRVVETGTRMASTVHILAGLSPGDVVITSGLLQMRIGQPVVALEAPPGPPAAQPTNTATAQSTNKPTAKSTAGVRAAAQL
jgi:membrane fusion protein (multidrug efflux system)